MDLPSETAGALLATPKSANPVIPSILLNATVVKEDFTSTLLEPVKLVQPSAKNVSPRQGV